MRFALIGDHRDGLDFAAAAVQAGHAIAWACHAEWPGARATGDFEEVLADPTVDAVIVASPIASRLDVARRVLQSERSGVVVHPVDAKPDGFYELAMLMGDTHQVLVPLLSDAVIDLPTLGDGEWIEWDVTDPASPLLHVDDTGRNAAFPGWSMLRRLLGELVEVTAYAFAEEINPGQPISLDGRGATSSFRARLTRRSGPALRELRLVGPSGPRLLNVTDASEAWPRLVAEFERAVAELKAAPRAEPAAGRDVSTGGRVAWRDAVRAAELDEAASRSIIKRRAVLLEYQEASEEVGFKGTMTLIGCGMLWFVIFLLILSAWQPWLGWLILPAIVAFLGLQLLGSIARR